jgi:serine/threonine protein phosphatase PrpC
MISHQGSREHNEDSAVCVETDGNYCFVVADGLGGHSKGEVASRTVIEIFEQQFANAKNNEDFLKNAFDKAQGEIIALQNTQNAKNGMKTTAVCLSIIDGKCQWGHVGDSRLYLFQKNKIKIRTLDHSVPQMLVVAGQIKENQIAAHPYRNRLLRAIGTEWDSPCYDLSEETEFSQTQDNPRKPAETIFGRSDCLRRLPQAFLLCTDGFWELIESKLMCKFLKKTKTVDEWLNLMTAEVEKNGCGKNMDNYTAIAIRRIT